MNIDNFIRHLELQKKGLKEKYANMEYSTNRIEKGFKKDPLYNEKMEVRQTIEKINSKLKFLRNLKRELLENEVQNKKR